MEDILSYTALNRKRINNICREVNMLEREYSSYSDAKLSSMTDLFRKELRSGKTINDIMPRALAVCKEAIKRKLGMTPYDTQIIAAASMSDNIIAEMQTGEGKTLVQMLASYLYALEATKDLDRSKWGSVHILTANEYLAQRDMKQNVEVFKLLGLSCDYAEDKSKSNVPTYRSKKVKAYNSDIVYATAKTVAFDYLDDNQVKDNNKRFINRGLYHAIVDEADDILIDQATTPLVLSGTMPGINMEDDLALTRWAARYAEGLTCKVVRQYTTGAVSDEDYDCTLYLDKMQVVFSEKLYKKIYGKADLTNLSIQEEFFNKELALTNALLAKFYFKKNKQYALIDNGTIKDKDGNLRRRFEVALISEATGRIMPKTRYRNGLQEALECLEELRSEGKYLIKHTVKNIERSKITYPDFAQLYETGISGMTGTSDIEEFKEIYGMETFEVSPRRKNIRQDEETELYATKAEKYKAIVNDVMIHNRRLQPILIGTTSVRESNELCKYLDAAGIRYQRLDAVNNEEEAHKVENAGKKGMITVATNMAGRGTDIKLGPGVEELGGLYVIGTSKNKSKRIDRQLKGRCARQGQPGKTKYYQSLEDDIVLTRCARHGLYGYKNFYKGTGKKIDNKIVLKMVDNCQRTEESINKQSRRITNEIENKVFRVHREKFFEQRNKILEASPRELISIMADIFKSYSIYVCDNPKELSKLKPLIDVEECYDRDDTTFKNNIAQSLLFRFRLSKGMSDSISYIEYVRSRVLDVLDTYWISHLINLEEMTNSIINNGGFGKDTLKRFEAEANEMFVAMGPYIQNEIIAYATTPNLAFGSYTIMNSDEMEEDYSHEINR